MTEKQGAVAYTPPMSNIRELAHLPSPGGRPQPLAFHGETLYVGSRDASRLYGLDPKTGGVVDDVALPGPPFGLVAHKTELRIVVSIGDDDDRYLCRYVPGGPFDAQERIELPDRNGSNLASDGRTLYLVQATNARIVALANDGSIERAVALPTRLAGVCFHDGTLYAITADE
jgi:outer membrane protein assembly factor BamB